MLGFRGCRLSVVYPEITEMQARAVAAAAAECKKVSHDSNAAIRVSRSFLSMLLVATRSVVKRSRAKDTQVLV